MARRLSVVLAAIGVISLAGCVRDDPCARLAPPTPAEIAAVQSGAQVEREIGSTECDLIGGRWQQEMKD